MDKKEKKKVRDYTRRRIEIPFTARCPYCNKYAFEIHHPDYNKPLEVIFLCRRCHMKLHKKTLNKSIPS
jgi:predicted SprT family Zn-dependent metalloprotease